MSTLLTEALKELSLQPGESRRVTVDDYEVEIRRRALDVQDAGPIVDIHLDVPPSPRSVTFVAKERTPILPDPIEITEADLAPE